MRSAIVSTYVLRCGVLMATAAVTVLAKPHQCALDDYAKETLAQYFPAALAAIESEAVARSGRSNAADDQPPLPVKRPHEPAATAVVPAPSTVPVKSTPCNTAAAGPSSSSSSSSSSPSPSTAAAIEKLTAYYEQLKVQQELLARHQLQQQMYEQQQRRQQEFIIVQQQIQQQYQQQQQHAMHMLEQLRKDPGFAGHMTAFFNHHKHADVAGNGTVPLKASSAEASGGDQDKSDPADEKNQIITNHKQTDAEDTGCGDGDAKHLEARRAAQQDTVDESDEFEDEPPVLEKVYSRLVSA